MDDISLETVSLINESTEFGTDPQNLDESLADADSDWYDIYVFSPKYEPLGGWIAQATPVSNVTKHVDTLVPDHDQDDKSDDDDDNRENGDRDDDDMEKNDNDDYGGGATGKKSDDDDDTDDHQDGARRAALPVSTMPKEGHRAKTDSHQSPDLDRLNVDGPTALAIPPQPRDTPAGQPPDLMQSWSFSLMLSGCPTDLLPTPPVLSQLDDQDIDATGDVNDEVSDSLAKQVVEGDELAVITKKTWLEESEDMANALQQRLSAANWDDPKTLQIKKKRHVSEYLVSLDGGDYTWTPGKYLTPEMINTFERKQKQDTRRKRKRRRHPQSQASMLDSDSTGEYHPHTKRRQATESRTVKRRTRSSFGADEQGTAPENEQPQSLELTIQRSFELEVPHGR